MNSPLISPLLESQLKQLLEKLARPVELTCAVDGSEKSAEMTTFLRHLCRLSPKLSCGFTEGGELLPATGVAGAGEQPRMFFHGIPGGKEINAFAAAILTAGGAAKPLDKPTLKDIGKIKKPMTLQVCVSLGCQHCAQLVSYTQRIAWENENVTVHMIDANLYPELVAKYKIERVPLTIVNGQTQIPGGKTMAELTSLLPKL